MRTHFKLATLSLCLYYLSGCNSYVTQTNFKAHEPHESTTSSIEYPYMDQPYMYTKNPYVYYDYNTVGRGVTQQHIGNATPTVYPNGVPKVNNYPAGRHISEAMPPKINAVNAPPYEYNSMGYTNDTTYNAVESAPNYQTFREQNPQNNAYMPYRNPYADYNSYVPAPPASMPTTTPISSQQQSSYNMYNYNQQNMLLETMAATSIMSMASTPTSVPPHLAPNKSQEALNSAMNATSHENVMQDSGAARSSSNYQNSAPKSLVRNTNLTSANIPMLGTKNVSDINGSNFPAPNQNPAESHPTMKKPPKGEQVEVIKEKETKVASLDEETIEEEIKKYNPDLRKMWEAHSGDDLQKLLTSWAKDAGWHVIWKTDRKYTLAAGAKMKGKFINVSSALVRAFARARPAPRAVYYKGNRVLLVTTMDDDNAE